MRFLVPRALCVFALAATAAAASPQEFDAYGRPLPSLERLCREGQMSGGPITEACARGGFRFNPKDENLTDYDFSKWGYNVLDRGVTEKDARRLDSDPAFRAKYIKAHGYDKHPTAAANNSAVKRPPEASCREDATFSQHIAEVRDQGATETYTLDAATKARGSDERRTKMRSLIQYAYQNYDLVPSDVASHYFAVCMSEQAKATES
jgi:hypothetical protein